jgi:hypothetical protein
MIIVMVSLSNHESPAPRVGGQLAKQFPEGKYGNEADAGAICFPAARSGLFLSDFLHYKVDENWNVFLYQWR